MKKIKMTENDLRLVILLTSLFLLAGGYFLAYLPNNTKKAEMQASNEQKEQRIKELQGMLLKKQEEIEMTEELSQEIEEIKEVFPAMLTEEKAIYIVDLLEKETGIEITSMSFNMENPYYMGDGVAIAGMQSQVGMSYENVSYGNLKKAISYINEYPDRMTIENLSCSYNEETNTLAGTIDVNFYAMQGTGKTYEPPVIMGIPRGVKNIFRNGK